MIPLENVFKTSLQDVLKISWRRIQNVLKTSWRYLEEVFARRLEDVLKTSWQDVLKTSWTRRMTKTNILVLAKTSWKRLKDVFWRRMTKANIFILIKTSWRHLLKTKTKYVFKTSSSKRMLAGNQWELQQITTTYSSDTEVKDFIYLYKDYTKPLFSFLVNDATLPSDNLLRFRKNLL